MRNKNLIPVRNLLRTLDVNSLRNPEVVANLVRCFGIVQWGPPVFGDEEQFKNADSSIVGIYQTPNQIAKALVYLSDYEISSYCEIGVFHGGNFLFTSEYLRRFNPAISCVAIDPTNFLNPEIAALIEEENYLRFFPITSGDISWSKLSLCMIDGDHTAEWVRKDWENIGQHADICMIHDIQEWSCPAVGDFWKELKEQEPERKTAEFLEHTSAMP